MIRGRSFDLFKETDKIHRCIMAIDKDDRGIALVDHFQLHFIKLFSALKHHDRLAEEVNKSMKEWIDYFLYEGREVDKMRYAIESNEKINKAHKSYMDFTASDELRWAYEARKKARMDHATMMAQAMKDGKAEGKKETLHEIVDNLKKIEIPIEKIAKVTELSIEEIKKL